MDSGSKEASKPVEQPKRNYNVLDDFGDLEEEVLD